MTLETIIEKLESISIANGHPYPVSRVDIVDELGEISDGQPRSISLQRGNPTLLLIHATGRAAARMVRSVSQVIPEAIVEPENVVISIDADTNDQLPTEDEQTDAT